MKFFVLWLAVLFVAFSASARFTSPTLPDATKHELVAPATETFTHDLDGNLTADGRWTYEWDAENRLSRVITLATNAPARRVDYEYDHAGRRIGRTVWDNTAGSGSPIAKTRYIYDGWNIVLELDGLNSNAPLRSYLWGLDLSGSLQGAGGVGGLLAVTDVGGSATHFVGHDGNGNVGLLVNAADGAVSGRYEYGPFGETIRVTGSAIAQVNPFRFSTKLADEFTGLTYYGYRDYNPSTGRWLSRDPLGEEGGLNLYGFLNNDSINSYDFLGWINAEDARRLGLSQSDIWWVNMYENAGSDARAYGRSLRDNAAGLVKGAYNAAVQSIQDQFDKVYDPVGYYNRKLESNLAMLDRLSRLASDPCEQKELLKNGKNWLWNKLTTPEGIGDTTFFLESLLAGRIGAGGTSTRAAAENAALRIAPYDDLVTVAGGQRHHLNQTAAFRDVIPHGRGMSVVMQGNILRDAGAPHTLAHRSMEGFWNTFRGTDVVPTNLQYTRALQQSFRASGMSEAQVQQAVRAAIRERVDFGLLGGMEVPRVPGPIRNIAQ